jgi:N-methylhydantoinase B
LDRDFLSGLIGGNRNPQESEGDFSAQISANRSGLARLAELLEEWGRAGFLRGLDALNDYAERLAREALGEIPAGLYRFEDLMDDDGQGQSDIPIRVALEVADSGVTVDFSGTAAQVQGNINAPLAVAAAAVYYVFRCLMPAHTPACAGSFRPIRIIAPSGCLLQAQRPAAVAAGNVETSTRVVDVVLGALAKAMPRRIPAASHGSMNNLAMGSDRAGDRWDYYETIGGGMGAGRDGGGLDGVQTHMTNTLNTPIEVIESRYPLRLLRYALRTDSGGDGLRRGGEGLLREFEFLRPAQATLLTERRRHRPWGSEAGAPGCAGVNRLNGEALPGKICLDLQPGDRLCIETPGGGGWGASAQAEAGLNRPESD